MPITNPRVLNFLTENYEKESRLRLKYAKDHEVQLRKAATFRGEIKNYTPDIVNKSVMVAGMTMITKDHAEAARHRLIAPVKDYLRAQVGTVKPTEPPMLPIKYEEKVLLRESSKQYLKARRKMGPEDKFNFVECVNWTYGWKLGDSEMKLRGPTHGRVCHMMHILDNHVGPQPDPEYYASPDASCMYCES